ncbi:MAG TPA: penicillin acylase family protein [Flavisolibacter sp.]|jgi:penicillin amidase
MRIIPFVISTVITGALVFALNKKWGAIPPLGKLLSPQQGFWQNAEETDHDYNQQLDLDGLKGKVNVYFDERLVPHVFAQHDEDAYFVQGYLHAKFRLWQMEFQTLAAAGRISEKMGSDERFLQFDREQRRLGMVSGAENALREMEASPETKSAGDAYTAGVNAYISSLSEAELPVEYKILDYRPEPWSNLKTALFLKQMSKTLAGSDRDLEFTNARQVFSADEIARLFTAVPDSLIPIVPAGTPFDSPGIVPQKPAGADSLYFGRKDSAIEVNEISRPHPNNGSNNWAVNGTKTQSGAPILCNDPHLGLTLPSIWYEMQISTPTMNVYGATFPGTPSVIIGFNDHVAFGFTNSQRDVKDYYYIRFKDNSKKEYWFNGQWQPTKLRIDTIRRRGVADFYDTVAYTAFGPVMYDQSFSRLGLEGKSLAVRWVPQEPSNEALMWLKLNRAKNYQDYEEALRTFSAPGQNMLFASKSGDIALWQQAKFPARWEGQGVYIMPGEDSSYMWQGYIPQRENPHVINPPSGFIQSANQRPVDSTYPYFVHGNFINARGVTAHNRLTAMQQITPQDMMKLQNDVYSSFAEDAVPLLMKYIDANALDAKEREYLSLVQQWDFYATADAKAPTVYQGWWDSLETVVWKDELTRVKEKTAMPDEQALLELLLRDSASKYIDDVSTPQPENLQQQVTKAFRLSAANLKKIEGGTGLLWWKVRNPSVPHLLQQAVRPFGRYGLQVGGWNNTLNAITDTHGPSWRMIVHLTATTEAYGIYPGGQSGNPGSRFYDNFIDSWAKGEYYTLWMMKESEAGDKRVKWKMSFS